MRFGERLRHERVPSDSDHIDVTGSVNDLPAYGRVQVDGALPILEIGWRRIARAAGQSW